MTPRRLIVFIAALGAGVSAAIAAGERDQGRSLVISQGGVVAAESPLAAQAGVQILNQGGNAVDAAVAANAVMGVVAPMMDGVGGDLFAQVFDARSGRLEGLNASGWAPRGLTPAYLEAKGVTTMPQAGAQAVTVPGAVAGWAELVSRHGRKSLAEDLAPAIALARAGYPVPEMTARSWASGAKVIADDPGAAATFLPGGRAPRVGDVFRNPDLAGTLSAIAAGGPAAFYRGDLARRIVTFLQAHGSPAEAADFAEYAPEWVRPIATTYHGWTVYEMPPNGQGLAALMMLNLMERFPLARMGFGSADALHVEIEAKKLAYADLARYVGDPRFHAIPVAKLLAKSWAQTRARALDLHHANPHASPGEMQGGSDTTYLCAADRDGNMVSLIQSNFMVFGSGLSVPGTGFVLHNRGALFTLDPASPNVLAARKRPLHTIIPAFAEHGTQRVAFGIMGGWNQAQAHAQFISDLADFHLNLQAALEAPRFTKATFDGADVDVENRLSPAVIAELRRRGHDVTVHAAYTDAMGGGQAVMRDFATGVNFGASDPRKDGEAVAQLPGSP